MTPEELAGLRPRLAEFAAEMLDGLPRSDQRAKGEWYLRGLLTDGQRKSMQPMADRLGIDHQQLQQFISSSTWDVSGVARNLALWASRAIDPVAYVLDDTGFVKDGSASACVARQYSGTLGKTANCQIGVSVHQVTNHASAASGWRLYCPASWDDHLAEDPDQQEQIQAHRRAAALPDHVRYRAKWELALDMLDELCGDGDGQAGLAKLPVVADAGYGNPTGFRLGLEHRGLSFVVAIRSDTSAHPAEAVPSIPETSPARGPRPRPRYRQAPVSVKDLALAAGRDAFTEVCWREGTRTSPANPTARMSSHFALLPVRPANRQIRRNNDGSLPSQLLLVEWPPEATEPTDYWLSNLPTDTSIEQLVNLAKIRWRVEHDYRELKHGLGLDHFEGRSWTGWMRHVTLVSIAQAFITMLRLDPKAPAPA